jgi:hypothetical protein
MTDTLDMEHLLATVAVAVVLAGICGLLFGFGRRTFVAVIILAMATNAFYPDGSIGLVVDALRPLRGMTDQTVTKRSARQAEADAALNGPPPTEQN